MSVSSKFFQVGGTMAEDIPSYIKRPADNELFAALEDGELCLILAPRQVGKSSLMVHTIARLKKKDIAAGYADFQSLGNQRNPDHWFGAIINQITRSLKLTTNSVKWWKSYKELDATQRFKNFLEDVVLTEIMQPVVLFFDEIDSVLRLPFSDDFFTTVRAIDNERAINPFLKRLTCVLIGTTTASSFIRDHSRTPFNIGRKIELDDFHKASTVLFNEVLGPNSEALIERIFYWTNGQPYLFQKLSETVYALPLKERTPEQIDTEVEHLYLQRKIEQDKHLKPIQDFLLADVKLVKETLIAYRTILQGEEIIYNEQSLVHNRLKLSGIVYVKDKRFVLRNRIYESVFNLQWLEEYADITREKISLVSDARPEVIVSGYKYDVFVSYAEIDNQPLFGDQEGWVTTLVKTLQSLLAQKLGDNAIFFWMDTQVAGNVPLVPQVMESLQNSAIFLIILSHGYLASAWCQREKNSFLNIIQDRLYSGSKVFIVEMDELSKEERPPEFGNVRGYRFWERVRAGNAPHVLGHVARGRQYYKRLNDLGYDLANELRRLKEQVALSEGSITAVNDEEGPVVFLAEVTDDLESSREAVRRYLLQLNIPVLPEKYYPREPDTFQQAVYQDLTQTTLFVQLISHLPGKKLSGLPQGYVRRQYEIARELSVPIFQWRSPTLDVDRVEEPDQRDLLLLETVLAVGIEEFKFELMRKITQQISASSLTQSPRSLVFVNAHKQDAALAEHIAKALSELELPYVMMPVEDYSPRKYFEAFEQNVLNCDAIIVVYGDVKLEWVSHQILAIRKIAWKRESPLMAFAIYDGPPVEKPDVMFNFQNVQILRCRESSMNIKQLGQFFTQLAGREHNDDK